MARMFAILMLLTVPAANSWQSPVVHPKQVHDFLLDYSESNSIEEMQPVPFALSRKRFCETGGKFNCNWPPHELDCTQICDGRIDLSPSERDGNCYPRHPDDPNQPAEGTEIADWNWMKHDEARCLRYKICGSGRPQDFNDPDMCLTVEDSTLCHLAKNRICDGVEDCKDGEDETIDNCLNDGKFYCTPNGQNDWGSFENPITVSKFRVCNGRPDCYAGNDEEDCFLCPNSYITVHLNQICDRIDDCKDKDKAYAGKRGRSSDEGGTNSTLKMCFDCDDGTRIKRYQAFDTVQDCPDNSDETPNSLQVDIGATACINQSDEKSILFECTCPDPDVGCTTPLEDIQTNKNNPFFYEPMSCCYNQEVLRGCFSDFVLIYNISTPKLWRKPYCKLSKQDADRKLTESMVAIHGKGLITNCTCMDEGGNVNNGECTDVRCMCAPGVACHYDCFHAQVNCSCVAAPGKEAYECDPELSYCFAISENFRGETVLDYNCTYLVEAAEEGLFADMKRVAGATNCECMDINCRELECDCERRRAWVETDWTLFREGNYAQCPDDCYDTRMTCFCGREDQSVTVTRERDDVTTTTAANSSNTTAAPTTALHYTLPGCSNLTSLTYCQCKQQLSTTILRRREMEAAIPGLSKCSCLDEYCIHMRCDCAPGSAYRSRCASITGLSQARPCYKNKLVCRCGQPGPDDMPDELWYKLEHTHGFDHKGCRNPRCICPVIQYAVTLAEVYFEFYYKVDGCQCVDDYCREFVCQCIHSPCSVPVNDRQLTGRQYCEDDVVNCYCDRVGQRDINDNPFTGSDGIGDNFYSRLTCAPLTSYCECNIAVEKASMIKAQMADYTNSTSCECVAGSHCQSVDCDCSASDCSFWTDFIREQLVDRDRVFSTEEWEMTAAPNMLSVPEMYECMSGRISCNCIKNTAYDPDCMPEELYCDVLHKDSACMCTFSRYQAESVVLYLNAKCFDVDHPTPNCECAAEDPTCKKVRCECPDNDCPCTQRLNYPCYQEQVVCDTFSRNCDCPLSKEDAKYYIQMRVEQYLNASEAWVDLTDEEHTPYCYFNPAGDRIYWTDGMAFFQPMHPADPHNQKWMYRQEWENWREEGSNVPETKRGCTKITPVYCYFTTDAEGLYRNVTCQCPFWSYCAESYRLNCSTQWLDCFCDFDPISRACRGGAPECRCVDYVPEERGTENDTVSIAERAALAINAQSCECAFEHCRNWHLKCDCSHGECIYDMAATDHLLDFHNGDRHDRCRQNAKASNKDPPINGSVLHCTCLHESCVYPNGITCSCAPNQEPAIRSVLEERGVLDPEYDKCACFDYKCSNFTLTCRLTGGDHWIEGFICQNKHNRYLQGGPPVYVDTMYRYCQCWDNNCTRERGDPFCSCDHPIDLELEAIAAAERNASASMRNTCWCHRWPDGRYEDCHCPRGICQPGINMKCICEEGKKCNSYEYRFNKGYVTCLGRYQWCDCLPTIYDNRTLVIHPNTSRPYTECTPSNRLTCSCAAPDIQWIASDTPREMRLELAKNLCDQKEDCKISCTCTFDLCALGAFDCKLSGATVSDRRRIKYNYFDEEDRECEISGGVIYCRCTEYRCRQPQCFCDRNTFREMLTEDRPRLINSFTSQIANFRGGTSKGFANATCITITNFDKIGETGDIYYLEPEFECPYVRLDCGREIDSKCVLATGGESCYTPMTCFCLPDLDAHTCRYHQCFCDKVSGLAGELAHSQVQQSSVALSLLAISLKLCFE